MVKPALKFFDVRSKGKFTSKKYVLKSKMTSRGKRFFAIAKTKSGNDAYRIVSEQFYRKNK